MAPADRRLTQGGNIKRTAASWLETFPPGAFVMVMATGIVSIAARLGGYPKIGWALFAINVVVYPLLWVITLCRLARYPRAVRADLPDHQRGPGFLTLIAATAVIGNQCSAYDLLPAVSLWLLVAALVLWFVLIYPFLTAMTISQRKPSLQTGLDGTWLLLVVATEACAILAVSVAQTAADPLPFAHLALGLWLLGGLLYLMLITLIFYRWCFVPMTPHDLTEPWWITMGAMAIAALAGSRLLLLAQTTTLFAHDLRPVLFTLTTAFWAMATFWIPQLAILFVAKHVVARDPIRYSVAEWSVVFPIGMYTAATHVYAIAAPAAYLEIVPSIVILIAFAAWGLAFIGAIRAMVRALAGNAAYPR
ncbi:tellurite resistance/C4-dicarboxylate transporter family protein [Trinickia dinghuensis]|uniref:C4-dicarboxylate ABC transporter n=1 Tax=Trinickia dinghuensis TaxID=2291023 RepID=A0A3D8K6B4_9BURK|nr:tellurite resistance/C4-dicarboxylate transporter family protein [Trinickia dinghuensis]RDV00859.1 C4-dicarboxylate ABC transporter [Trinickia dinghuensis]